MRLSCVHVYVALWCSAATGLGAQELAIQNCVSAAEIRLRADDPRALLEEDDRQEVHARMLARYPVFGRDGVVPTHILLWRRDGSWTYATLLEDPGQPGRWCYTATFSAGVFDLTPRLLGKYFGLHHT